MRTVAFSGGLGDVLIHVYLHDAYAFLDALTPGERVRAVVDSPNPGVRSLVELHPKAGQIDIVGSGPSDPPRCRGTLPVRFYPSDEDRRALSRIAAPYAVFSLSTGSAGYLKNVPPWIAQEAVDVAHGAGLTSVLVGKTYSIPHQTREEVRVPVNVDLVDRLSVHGLMTLLEGASAVFASYSAVAIGAWLLRRPVFVAYPRDVEREFTERWYCTFGRDYPESKRVLFEDWTKDVWSSFLSDRRRSS